MLRILNEFFFQKTHVSKTPKSKAIREDCQRGAGWERVLTRGHQSEYGRRLTAVY
jgi:hypothetical protein